MAKLSTPQLQKSSFYIDSGLPYLIGCIHVLIRVYLPYVNMCKWKAQAGSDDWQEDDIHFTNKLDERKKMKI